MTKGGNRADLEPQHGLLLAILLAGLAGMVDAIGLMRLGHLFVSFMSGNSTQFAIAVGRGRFADATSILLLIVCFILGAAGGQVIGHISGAWHLSAILAAISVLLTISALFDTAPLPMVLAMGSLNAAMHRAGSLPVSLTFITGTLVRLGAGLGDLLIGRNQDWGWIEQAAPWLGIVGGAILAGAAHARIGPAVDWIPVTTAVALFATSLVIRAPS